MKTRLLLLVKLRIEVGATKTANDRTRKCRIIGRIAKVLFHLIDAIGRLYKMIGLNRFSGCLLPLGVHSRDNAIAVLSLSLKPSMSTSSIWDVE